MSRILDALRAGWAAACARWREGEPEVKRKDRCSWFDIEPGTFEPPASADDEEADAWYRAHFRSGWPR